MFKYQKGGQWGKLEYTEQDKEQDGMGLESQIRHLQVMESDQNFFK